MTAGKTDAWNEFAPPDLEDLMFGDPKYLENNAFSTSHQSVNVYGLPEKIYDMKRIRVVAAVIHSEDKIFATARGYDEFKGQWLPADITLVEKIKEAME